MGMRYNEEADLIGIALAIAVPELSRNTPKGMDFRPGGGGEQMVSGLYWFTGDEALMATPLNEFRFKCLFGNHQKRDAAAEGLCAFGIVALCEPPDSLNPQCWRLSFSIPRGWMPYLPQTQSEIPVHLL